jgi:hypothetical protein
MAADGIAPAAYDAALALVAKAMEALPTIPIETSLDLVRVAQTADLVYRIGRLASGLSTSNVAHASLTPEDRDERRARLLAQLGIDVHADKVNEDPSSFTDKDQSSLPE